MELDAGVEAMLNRKLCKLSYLKAATFTPCAETVIAERSTLVMSLAAFTPGVLMHRFRRRRRKLAVA